MRNLKKNSRTMYYALYDSEIPVYGEDGNPELETMAGYKNREQVKASVSTGQSDA